MKAIPEINITISCPTIRMDNQKARLTILNIRKKLSVLNINIIDYENINQGHLGRRGLHLNNKGSARLAMNYLSRIRNHHQLSRIVFKKCINLLAQNSKHR